MAGGPPPSSFQTSPWLPPEADAATVGNNTMTPLDAAAASNNINRAAVAVACVQCRSRHLKCDGAVRCSRCVADGIACSYVKSRRGWKGPRKSTRLQHGPSVGMDPPFPMRSIALSNATPLTIDRPTRTARRLRQLCIASGWIPRSAEPSRPCSQDSRRSAICRGPPIA